MNNPHENELLPLIEMRGLSWEIKCKDFTQNYESYRTLRKEYAYQAYGSATLEEFEGDYGSTLSSVVSIGAGTGYVENLLNQLGFCVEAFDKRPYSNSYVKGNHYSVERGTEQVLRGHKADTLLLIWPEHNTSAAFDALTLFEGDYLVYGGEGRGGCTGDENFHRMLEDKWKFLKSYPVLTIHNDCLMVFKRLQGSI